MVKWNQSGYVGTSMSVRAVEAYDNGYMPLSKWTKKAILEEIASLYGEEVVNHVKSWSKDFLAETFLEYKEWHHTGKYAIETDFYGIKDELDEKEILAIVPPVKARKPKEESKKRFAVVIFSEWEKKSRYGRWQKKDYKAIAEWVEKGGKQSMVTIYFRPKSSYAKKKFSSLYIDKELQRMPAKNEKIWNEMGAY